MHSTVLKRFRSEWTADPHPECRIRNGTRDDYARLARFHYRAGAPATIVQILAAETPDLPRETIGVLVVSMPVLNGTWRAIAWPDLNDGPDRRTNARRLNRQVRTISRVIVEPRFRSVGVATRLVRAYLNRPRTRRTESIAAMGVWSDFFVAAGMRRIPVPRSRRDRRLLRVLDTLGLPPWTLADPCGRRLDQCDRQHLDRALRSWALASGATRRRADDPLHERITLAARSIATRMHAFVAEATDD